MDYAGNVWKLMGFLIFCFEFDSVRLSRVYVSKSKLKSVASRKWSCQELSEIHDWIHDWILKWIEDQGSGIPEHSSEQIKERCLAQMVLSGII